jgi:hypothetical protein
MSRPSTQFQQHQRQHLSQVKKHNEGVHITLEQRKWRDQLQQGTQPAESKTAEFEDPAMTLWRWLFKGRKHPSK